MRYLSLFSGIEAASAAWLPLGWAAVAFSEIDKFPSAVLAHHYPDVPNVGDITKFDWSKYHGRTDVVVGGSPCQSFSVAGQRKGLDDERGKLMFAYLEAIDRIRPRWLVWENVPGVLSSNGGRDFGAFLGHLAKLGYGFAYRILDAQYFGLAQRRKRVFVVGHLGNWRPAAAVLFESESLRWDSAPCRSQGEAVASTIGRSFAKNSGIKAGKDCEPRNIIPILEAGARTGKSTTDIRAGSCIGKDGEPMFTLQADKQHAIAFNLRGRESGSQPELTDIASLRASSGGSSRSYIGQSMAVRRLTPKECERLMGFPDSYTDIPYHGRPAADSPRYKALGNSMAVPVIHWLGERIAAVDAIGKQLQIERY